MDAALPVSCEPVTCDFAAVIGDELRVRFETPPRGWRGVNEVSVRSPGLSRGWRGVGQPKAAVQRTENSMKPGAISRAGDGNRTRMTSLEGPRTATTVDLGGRRRL